jgi:hypothetical protein
VLYRNWLLRKIASILLISLLLFNWVGYRIVSQVLESNANATLEKRLDQNDYDESQLIEMRVDLHLPYQNDWADFERFNGELEINGVHYKYVKRKIEKGQLVVLCIPNKSKMQIEESRHDFFKLVNDLPNSSQGNDSGKSTSVSKGMFTDYQAEINNWSILSPGKLIQKHNQTGAYFLTAIDGSTPERPPDFC